jgi:hypothetical protein
MSETTTPTMRDTAKVDMARGISTLAFALANASGGTAFGRIDKAVRT